MTKIRFSFDVDRKDQEKEEEKAESMNNIMATDEYKVKDEAEIEANEKEIKITIKPKCTK